MIISTLARSCGTLAALALLGAAHAQPAPAQPAVPRSDTVTARRQSHGGASAGVPEAKKPSAPTPMGGMTGGVLGDKSARQATTMAGRPGADTIAAHPRTP
jgi:hypothetical protein